MSTKHTIKVVKYSDVIKELEAYAAITPGKLLERVNDATIKAHSDKDGPVAPIIFALEDELQGKNIDEAYADGDRVQAWYPQRGDVVYALLAEDQNIAIADKMVSAGDGTLKKRDPESGGENTQCIVAVAIEAIDRTGSSGEDEGTRILVEIA